MTQKEKIEFLERNVKRLKQENQKLRQVIKGYKYDSLTGLPLRADFHARFDEMFYEHQEFGHRFILAMIDMNGLHALNRDISFEAGDEFIQRVACDIKGLFEDSNAFRIGGDEFALLKRGNNIEDFYKRLNSIDGVEFAVTTTQDGHESEQEMFNFVDAQIIEKKDRNCIER